MRKSKKTQEKKTSTKKVESKFDRSFGTPPDKELGRYLKDRGLLSLAQILKVD